MGLLSTLFSCNKNSSNPEEVVKGDAKYRSVMKITDGIIVTHTPSEVSAEEEGRSGYKYTWIHETSVRSSVGHLKIVEFGAFHLQNTKWVFSTYTGKPFTSDDFAEWYNCPEAMITEGDAFIDPKNWTGSEALHESSTLWYFIGEDASGQRYKGISQVDTLAQTKS